MPRMLCPPALRHRSLAMALAGAIGMTACGGGQDAAPPAFPPPEVGIVIIEPRDVVLQDDLPGRVEASRVAEVRARAAGIVLDRAFREGSDVEAGQLLFRIDPAPLVAALRSAEAAELRARTQQMAASARADRFEAMAKAAAVSHQDREDAVAARDLAAAELAAATAAVETARLNLGYADVVAPIAGRIGQAEVTEGALVGQDSPTLLARIQQFDPVYVNLALPSSDLFALQQAIGNGRLAAIASPTVTLLDRHGEALPQRGTVLFTDARVDPETSTVMVRVEFPNPDGILLPGMYVRVKLDRALAKGAAIIPPQAVQQTAQGALVMLVGAGGTVTPRPIELGPVQAEGQVVVSGLSAGDRVIVDGHQKIQPGIPVTPVAATGEDAGAPVETEAAADAPSAAGSEAPAAVNAAQ